MARSVCTKWELPLAFYAYKNASPARINSVIRECVHALHSIDMQVKLVVCDGARENRTWQTESVKATQSSLAQLVKDCDELIQLVSSIQQQQQPPTGDGQGMEGHRLAMTAAVRALHQARLSALHVQGGMESMLDMQAVDLEDEDDDEQLQWAMNTPYIWDYIGQQKVWLLSDPPHLIKVCTVSYMAARHACTPVCLDTAWSIFQCFADLAQFSLQIKQYYYYY